VRGSQFNPAVFNASAIRAIVVEGHEHDADVFEAARALGANTIVTHANPDAETAALAHAHGLFYIGWMSVDDLSRAEDDPVFAARLASVHPLAAIYYEDGAAPEGYASVAAQERSYAEGRRIFPCALILHPTRLDPIATDPGFLAGYYRPEYTDLVVPYFYPVGTTVLGTFSEGDAWLERLASLLAPLVRATPEGKGLLPVLQGFEQIGYPVSETFLSAQMAVYGAFWPSNRNAALFEWGSTALDAPLVGLGFRPALQAGASRLFAGLSTASRALRVVPFRRP
jgi:hypothetical protein